ncbi:MAG: DapH/DapD/GlmU-related protein [Litoreibacter sp.]|nr:DapH/DapD/GlmU-related protein [Litoreibacter sp.]
MKPRKVPAFSIQGPAPLDDFSPGTVSFCTKPKIPIHAASTENALLICLPDAITASQAILLPVENPRLAFGKLIEAFFAPKTERTIHPTATIHASSHVARDAAIGPGAVIGPNCTIGAGSQIGANTVLERNVQVGAGCIIRAGCAIGQPGFGIETDANGNNYQLPHIGGVVIEDHVTIGCLTSIASGTLTPTRICHGAILDDQVFIAHNVHIGERSLVIACAEVSGSVHIGKGCWIGPNSSIMNQASIGDRSLIGLGAVVTKSCPENVVLIGSPARILKERYPA